MLHLAVFALLAHQTQSLAVQRILLTDYLYQDNPQFAGGGTAFCAPTTIAMGFSWLAKSGYPNLLPQADSQQGSLIKIGQTLAKSGYMSTNLATGTDMSEVIKGVVRYVKETGYTLSKIEYSGWRPMAKGTPGTRQSRVPNLNQFNEGLQDPHSITLLNLGYYKQMGDAYRRTGGHWVLLVGEKDDAGDMQREVFIHNPALNVKADVAGSQEIDTHLQADEIRLSPFTNPLEDAKAHPITLPNFLYSVKGPALTKTRSATLLDGIVVFTMG